MYASPGPPYFDHDNPFLSAAPFTSFVPLPPSYFLFDYSFFLPEPSGPRQGFDLPQPQPPVGPLKDNTANPYYTFPVSPCASLPCIFLLRLQTESETRLRIALRRFGQRTVHHTSKDEGVAICVQHAWR